MIRHGHSWRVWNLYARKPPTKNRDDPQQMWVPKAENLRNPQSISSAGITHEMRCVSPNRPQRLMHDYEAWCVLCIRFVAGGRFTAVGLAFIKTTVQKFLQLGVKVNILNLELILACFIGIGVFKLSGGRQSLRRCPQFIAGLISVLLLLGAPKILCLTHQARANLQADQSLEHALGRAAFDTATYQSFRQLRGCRQVLGCLLSYQRYPALY